MLSEIIISYNVNYIRCTFTLCYYYCEVLSTVAERDIAAAVARGATAIAAAIIAHAADVAAAS